MRFPTPTADKTKGERSSKRIHRVPINKALKLSSNFVSSNIRRSSAVISKHRKQLTRYVNNPMSSSSSQWAGFKHHTRSQSQSPRRSTSNTTPASTSHPSQRTTHQPTVTILRRPLSLTVAKRAKPPEATRENSYSSLRKHQID